MDAYHAVYLYHARPSGNVPGEMIEEPVVIIEAVVIPGMIGPNVEPTWPEVNLIAVAQKDGRHIVASQNSFRCTEPIYLGKPDPVDPSAHPHEWTAWRPVLEDNRLVGMTRSCTVEGCGETETTPTPKASPK